MKYILSEEKTLEYDGHTLHRIMNVETGEYGGYVESLANLSQDGKCWIGKEAKVYGDARVEDDAIITGYAVVKDNATVEGRAYVAGNAMICDHAHVYGNAHVFDYAKITNYAGACDLCLIDEKAVISGHALIKGHSHVYGNARVSEDAVVYENAVISGNATIVGNCAVVGCCIVTGDAFAGENQRLEFGNVNCNLTSEENLPKNIYTQCNLVPENGKVIAYKRVDKNLHSFYDTNFVYEVGKESRVVAEESKKSCAAGLHFSNPSYWDNECHEENTILLKAEINLDDIVTVQNGKIRCCAAKILSAINI